jgi:hypothetical protein
VCVCVCVCVCANAPQILSTGHTRRHAAADAQPSPNQHWVPAPVLAMATDCQGSRHRFTARIQGPRMRQQVKKGLAS